MLAVLLHKELSSVTKEKRGRGLEKKRSATVLFLKSEIPKSHKC
jgi:hypothetical protein